MSHTNLLFWITLYAVHIFSLFGSKFAFRHICTHSLDEDAKARRSRFFSCFTHVIKLAAELQFHVRFYFKSTCTVSNLAANSKWLLGKTVAMLSYYADSTLCL